MKKGFTLIELLAVIVILAIIAIIATPIVLNIINDTRKSASVRSVENYGKAVEQAVASYQLSGNKTSRGLYTTTDGKKLILDTTELNVNYNGSKIICNTINVYNDGQVYIGNCAIDDKSTDAEYGPKYYANGTPIYFNVSTGLKCLENDYTSNTDKMGKTGCMKFYAFNDYDSNKISLLLDHNIASASWINETDYIDAGGTNWLPAPNSTYSCTTYNGEDYCGSTDKGPITLMNVLKSNTKEWLGTEIPNDEKFSIAGEDEILISYNLNYATDNYKARLIEKTELDKVLLDSPTALSWLSDNCGAPPSDLPFGYWTSSASERHGTASIIYLDSNSNWADTTMSIYGRTAWGFSGFESKIDDTELVLGWWGLPSGVGLRPVIEVLKSKLK